MSKEVAEILQDLGDRYEEHLRLQAAAKIVRQHPEWLEQEPELKKLLKSAA